MHAGVIDVANRWGTGLQVSRNELVGIHGICKPLAFN
jgi:hypothetical protein